MKEFYQQKKKLERLRSFYKGMFGYHVILSALAGLISGYCIFDLASIMAIALWMYVFVIGMPVVCPHYKKLADALREDIRSLEKRIEKAKEIHVALDSQRA